MSPEHDQLAAVCKLSYQQFYTTAPGASASKRTQLYRFRENHIIRDTVGEISLLHRLQFEENRSKVPLLYTRSPAVYDVHALDARVFTSFIAEFTAST